jgi:beta-lactamase superfamily II metal-dependent hydrolase
VTEEVLARYRAAAVEVFRTSEDGAVTVTTDGTTVSVQAFTGRRLTITTTKVTEDTKEHAGER